MKRIFKKSIYDNEVKDIRAKYPQHLKIKTSESKEGVYR